MTKLVLKVKGMHCSRTRVSRVLPRNSRLRASSAEAAASAAKAEQGFGGQARFLALHFVKLRALGWVDLL